MDSKQSSVGVLWSRLFGSDPEVASETAKMNGASKRTLSGNFAALARDLAKMADLQIQLLSLDVRQFWPTARSGIFLACVAVMAVVGAIPVLLFGLAGLLELAGQISPVTAKLIVGSVACMAGTLALWYALRTLGNAAESFQRSQAELTQNLKWMREVLHQDED